MTKLLVLTLLAGTPDGGLDALYSDCPVRGAITVEARDAGTFYVLSEPQAQRAACLMETCETRRLQLEPVAKDVTWQAWLAGVVVAFFVGALVGGVFVFTAK